MIHIVSCPEPAPKKGEKGLVNLGRIIRPRARNIRHWNVLRNPIKHKCLVQIRISCGHGHVAEYQYGLHVWTAPASIYGYGIGLKDLLVYLWRIDAVMAVVCFPSSASNKKHRKFYTTFVDPSFSFDSLAVNS